MAVEFTGETRRAGAIYRDWPENIIVMPELNGRHENTDIESLAADIEAHGQRTPVVIRKDDNGRAVLVYGHRRWRALMLLNERNPEHRREIVCNYFAMSETEAFIAAIGENRFRKDVSPIDDAANMKVLRDRFGLADDKIAEIYFPESKSDPESLKFVKDRLKLVELAPEAAQAVRDGRVKLTAALALSRLTKTQQRAKVEGTEGRIRVSDAAKKPAKPKPIEAELTRLITAVLDSADWDNFDETKSVQICINAEALAALRNYVLGEGEVS